MEYLLADLYKERMGKGSGERGGRGTVVWTIRKWGEETSGVL